MLLLIDAGNTRIKWALAAMPDAAGVSDSDNAGAAQLSSGANGPHGFDDTNTNASRPPANAQWQASGAVTHAELPLLAATWSAALAGRTITRALVCNVAGAALGAQLQAMLPEGALRWFTSVPMLAGLANGYRNPYQLGADRFAAAIGALSLAPGRACIVANCGTATTIDAISADGHFVGGMILPGLRMMAAALARDTAQLPLVADGAAPLAPGVRFADNTDDAIQSGCLAAQTGAIERACAAHGAVECIVSGGAAPSVAAALNVPHRLVENIVLIGLHAAARSDLGESAC